MDGIRREIITSVTLPPETGIVCVPPLPTSLYCTEKPVKSPLRWIQSTGPQWTVMLEEVTSDTLTEVGGADGAVYMCEKFRIEEREETENSVRYTNQQSLWWLWYKHCNL